METNPYESPRPFDREPCNYQKLLFWERALLVMSFVLWTASTAAVAVASFGLFVAFELRGNFTFSALMVTLFLVGSSGMWWAQRIPQL